MNFKTLLLTVGLLAPMTLASVEDDIRSDFNGACRDLMNDLVKMDIPYLEGVTSCGVDQAGEIYELKMNNLYLDESIVNKIFSDHKEIKYLEYNYINNSENIKVKNIPKSISSLKYLKGLTISFSRENNNLPEGLLKPLKDLRGLELNNVKLNSNTIKEISELSNLTKLTLLECEQNNLDFDRLNSLEKIEELSLNGINLKEYPKFIFSLPKIETLDLSENKLTYISDKLSKFKNLVKLNLSNNEINDEIPQSLNSLSHLEDVNFENNIKIKGKMLTNDSLKSCQYYAPEDEDDNTEYPYLCMPKEMKCINTTNHCRYEKHCYLGIEKPETLGCYLACKQQHFKLCSSSTKTTITKTSTKKSSTKKSSTKKSSTKKSSTKKSSTKKSSTKKSSTKSSYPTSTNGKCGKDYGKCPSGTCCSKWGYCGKTESHCGSGCQSEFGKCN